jgi:phosphate uptake regulator
MAALAEQNHDLARTILKSDDEVDRFSLYILRNLDHFFACIRHITSQLVLIYFLLSCESTLAVCNQCFT